jgi:hypothetical protein
MYDRFVHFMGVWLAVKGYYATFRIQFSGERIVVGRVLGFLPIAIHFPFPTLYPTSRPPGLIHYLCIHPILISSQGYYGLLPIIAPHAPYLCSLFSGESNYTAVAMFIAGNPMPVEILTDNELALFPIP